MLYRDVLYQNCNLYKTFRRYYPYLHWVKKCLEDLRAWLFRKDWDFLFNSILARCFKYFHISPFFLQNGLAVQFSAICRGTYQLHTYILKVRPIPFRSCMETHSSTFTRLQNKGRNYMLKGRNYNFYEHGRIFLHTISKILHPFNGTFHKLLVLHGSQKICY